MMLKALALQVLERNRRCNSDATSELHKPEIIQLQKATDATPVAYPLQAAERALREAEEERAAICEHDARMPRLQAERMARAAYEVWLYRLTDDPGQWLTLVTAAGTGEVRVREALGLRYGADIVLAVVPKL